MNREELLYNKICEKTKNCGRSQLIRLLMDKERENQELKDKLERVNKKIEKMFDDGDEYRVIDDLLELQKIIEESDE